MHGVALVYRFMKDGKSCADTGVSDRMAGIVESRWLFDDPYDKSCGQALM